MSEGIDAGSKTTFCQTKFIRGEMVLFILAKPFAMFVSCMFTPCTTFITDLQKIGISFEVRTNERGELHLSRTSTSTQTPFSLKLSILFCSLLKDYVKEQVMRPVHSLFHKKSAYKDGGGFITGAMATPCA